MKKILLSLILALISSPALAISLTNCQGNQASAASVAITGFVLTTPGDGIFVFSSTINTVATLSIADNGSGGSQTYSQIGSYSNASVSARGAMFLATNVTSPVNGATITATWTAGATTSIIVCEVLTMATSSALDGTPATSNGAMVSALTSGALTTTNTGNDVLVYCIQVGSTTISAQTAGSGYAIPSGATNTHAACQTKSVTGAQSGVTTSISWTGSASEVSSLFAALKQAPATVTNKPHSAIF